MSSGHQLYHVAFNQLRMCENHKVLGVWQWRFKDGQMYCRWAFMGCSPFCLVLMCALLLLLLLSATSHLWGLRSWIWRYLSGGENCPQKHPQTSVLAAPVKTAPEAVLAAGFQPEKVVWPAHPRSPSRTADSTKLLESMAVEASRALLTEEVSHARSIASHPDGAVTLFKAWPGVAPSKPCFYESPSWALSAVVQGTAIYLHPELSLCLAAMFLAWLEVLGYGHLYPK